jgi:hypothetical protein
MTRNPGMASSLGQMDESTTESGAMASSMASASSWRKMESRNKDAGKLVDEFAGSMKLEMEILVISLTLMIRNSNRKYHFLL